MKIIVTDRKVNKRFLVHVQSDAVLKDLAFLIGSKKYSKAASLVLTRGHIEKEVMNDELNKVGADLIIEGGAK